MRDLRVSYLDRLGWVVIDKTGRNPCGPGAPILFAHPRPDPCHAWLRRQLDGAPSGKLTPRRETEGRPRHRKWFVEDEAGRCYGIANTHAIARDCIRIILANPPALTGEFMP